MKQAAFDPHAVSIARRQYLRPDDKDVFDMFRRVAGWVASCETPATREAWEQKFYQSMAEKRFCPGGRVLAGAGTAHGNVLNCFVQGATEHESSSFLGVMEVAKKLALVTKVGGGNGVNLDSCPPKADTSSLGTVRGWAYLNSTHPDVEDFILGMMRPPTTPDGEKIPITVRNWTRVVYGMISPELAALARRNGVLTVRERPASALLVADSMAGIIDSAAVAAEAGIRGEEPRVDFSVLRAEGAPIQGSGGSSSGPVSFLLEIFDNLLEWANLGGTAAGPVATLRYVYAPVLRVVRQGGTRRGAGMATLSLDHPDLLDLLTAKNLDREAAEGDISTFNISLLVSEAFWETLQADDLWPVRMPEIPGKYYPVDLESAYHGELPDLPDREVDGARAIPLFEGKAPAKWLWHEVAWNAWATGEPGLIFIDRVNDQSALKTLGPRYQIRSTNPCGEIPLTVGEPCDLGALNLAAYIQEGSFDFEAFREDIPTAVRFLDNVLEVNVFALEDNREASHKLRRLGLGVMGLADALIKMGLSYDTKDARDAVFGIMSVLREEAVKASEALAQERGAFPLYQEEQEAFEALGLRPRRNVAVLTVAPTGTTSMLMGASSGIEPVFSPFVWRRIGGEHKALLHPLFVELMEQLSPHADYRTAGGGWDWDKLSTLLQTTHGSVQGLEAVPKDIQKVFKYAHDVPPLDHVRMQGTVQRAFDAEDLAGNSLSKTINLPNHASVSDVESAYAEAHRTGCKGITVYRDGSRDFQVLSSSKVEAAPKAPAAEEPAQSGRSLFERTGRLYGFTDMVKLNAADGTQRSFLVTVNLQGKHPVEVILTSGRAGDEVNADSESLGRVISIALQYGVPPKALVKTLRGINGGLYGSYNKHFVASKSDLIAVALESATQESNDRDNPPARLADYSEAAAADPVPTAGPKGQAGPHCPKCGAPLRVEEGCLSCTACGYSRCG